MTPTSHLTHTHTLATFYSPSEKQASSHWPVGATGGSFSGIHWTWSKWTIYCFIYFSVLKILGLWSKWWKLILGPISSYYEKNSLKRWMNWFAIYVGPTLKLWSSDIHQEDSSPCNLCEKTFTNKVKLKDHKRYVHSNSSYECQECKKTYSNPQNLKIHQKIHPMWHLYHGEMLYRGIIHFNSYNI